MEMKDFNIEFVKRTKEIIELTEKYYFKYEVTLLINCLTGLISLPTEKTGNKKIDQKFQDTCVNKLDKMDVIVYSKDNKKIFRCIKNALSHIRIEIMNENKQIAKIEFKDQWKDDVHTILLFTVDKLREYALFMADTYIEMIK